MSSNGSMAGCDEKGKNTFFLEFKGGEAASTAKCKNVNAVLLLKCKAAMEPVTEQHSSSSCHWDD